jgi:hypothetical protein
MPDEFSGLDERLFGLKHRPDGIVMLVGHSLGSVIAADYLRVNAQRLSSASNVILVTLGSPLARLLHRFFPFIYPRPVDLLANVKSLLPGFLWLNTFRPFDPIGGRLGIARKSYGLEYSTGQVFLKRLLLGIFLCSIGAILRTAACKEFAGQFFRSSLHQFEKAVSQRQQSPDVLV